MSIIGRSLVLIWLLCAGLAFSAPPGLAGFLTGPNNVPVTGARLTLIRTDTSRQHTVRSDAQGFFRFSDLDPGPYKLTVEADGYAPLEHTGLEVTAGTSTQLSLRLVPIRPGVGELTGLALETRQEALLRTGLDDSPLNSMLSEARSSRLLELVPGFYDEVTFLSFSSPGYHGPAFHGSTAAENRYRLDGLDITDPMTGLLSVDLPIEFIRGIVADTGGMPASTGGLTGSRIDLQSKFGGNEFHGDVFFYLTPYEPEREYIDESTGPVALSRRERRLIRGQAGIDLGGYIVPDRLWFFIGIAPGLELGESTRILGFAENPTTQLHWELPFIARLTLNPTPDQTVQVSAYGAPQELRGVVRDPTDTSTGMNGDPSTYLGTREDSSYAGSGRYALRIPRIRTRMDLQLGFLQRSIGTLPEEIDLNLDGIYEGELPQVVHLGAYPVRGTLCDEGFECAPLNYRTGGLGLLHELHTTRLGGTFQVSHWIRQFVGDHQLSWGGDLRRDRLEHAERYTGAALYYEIPQDDETLLAEQYLLSDRGSRIDELDRALSTTLLAAFLQDSWTPLPRATVNLGVRIDAQSIQTPSSGTYRLTPILSPRLLARFSYRAWRPGIISAGFGRYASSLPLWLADAAFLTPAVQSEPEVDLPETTPSLNYRVATSVKTPYLDELVAGIDQELTEQLRIGIFGINRVLRNTIEPLAYPDGLVVLGNPGTDPGQITNSLQLSACFREDAPISGELQRYCYSAPERVYRAVELRLDRIPRDRRGLWLHASYSLGRLEGDYPGPIPQQQGTEPAASLSVYNLLNLDSDNSSGNRSGPLPADRSHRANMTGALELFFGLKAGVGIQVRSGMPIDVIGLDPTLEDGTVLLYPRGAAGRTAWVIDQQVSLGYEFRFGESRELSLEATAFNPLQLDAALRADSRYVLSVAAPAGGSFDPAQASQQLTCADPTTLSLVECQVNPEFGNTLERQAPFSLRIVARFSF